MTEPIDYAEYFGGPIQPGEVERLREKLGIDLAGIGLAERIRAWAYENSSTVPKEILKEWADEAEKLEG
jgi:hypothetical protein